MKYNAGLVLEGGGMRASYTNGVLDYFMENNIEFKYVVGVSAGIMSGMNYISKQQGRARTLSVDYADDKRTIGVSNLIKHGQYFNLSHIYKVLDKEVFFDYDAFFNNDTIFKIGCFDVATGDVRYFNKNYLKENDTLDPIIASNSLPLLSKIVPIEDKKYLDGGIRDSIPLNISIADGNKKNVIILTNPIEYRRQPESTIKYIKVLYRKYPKLIEALKRRHTVYNDMLDRIEVMEKNKEVFIIRPSIKLEVSRYSKDKDTLLAAYDQGYSDAERLKEELIEFLDSNE